jgi:hypothetical protein
VATRGELIGFQDALERKPGNAKLAVRVQQLLQSQLRSLPTVSEVTWKLGFISELRLEPDRSPRDLATLLRHPLLQLVESVSLVDRGMGWFDDHASTSRRQLLECVMEHAPRAMLRRIEIGDPRSTLFETADQLQLACCRRRTTGNGCSLFPRRCACGSHVTRRGQPGGRPGDRRLATATCTRARRAGGRTGAITFVQRFDGLVDLHTCISIASFPTRCS